MCEYCYGDVGNRRVLLVDDFNNEIYISGNNTIIGNDNLELDEIKINYCPMCGRKFDERQPLNEEKKELLKSMNSIITSEHLAYLTEIKNNL